MKSSVALSTSAQLRAKFSKADGRLVSIFGVEQHASEAGDRFRARVEKPIPLIQLVAADFTRESERDVLVETPVDRFFALGVGGRRAPTGFLMPLAAGEHELAQSP